MLQEMYGRTKSANSFSKFVFTDLGTRSRKQIGFLLIEESLVADQMTASAIGKAKSADFALVKFGKLRLNDAVDIRISHKRVDHEIGSLCTIERLFVKIHSILTGLFKCRSSLRASKASMAVITLNGPGQIFVGMDFILNSLFEILHSKIAPYLLGNLLAALILGDGNIDTT